MHEYDEEAGWVVTLNKQHQLHQAILIKIGLLGSKFDKSKPQVKANTLSRIQLEAKAEELAWLIRWTKLSNEIARDAKIILDKWTEMKEDTGLTEDFGVTEHLTAMMEVQVVLLRQLFRDGVSYDGVPDSYVTRIRSAFNPHWDPRGDGGIRSFEWMLDYHSCTVAEFLARASRQKLLRIPNFGKKTLEQLNVILVSSGYDPIPEK